MKLLTFLFLIILVPFITRAQEFPNSDLIPGQVDSIRLNVELIRGKEMLPLGNEEEVYKLLGSIRLLPKDANKFIKRISKKSSYTLGRAMLGHHSLSFTCFSNDKVALTVHISTLTGNINLYKEGVDSFYGKISKKMGDFLVNFLVRLNLYGLLQEIGDTEGLK